MVIRRLQHLVMVLAGCCLCLFVNASQAAVSAQLSAQNIDELETVRLSIKISETRQSQTLDLSALEEDFQILNTNTISQSRFVNGRGQSWVDYQITLQPKKTGLLTIPSIAVGAERTPSLELRVRPLSDQTRQLISELVFFENSVSDTSIYVQSQLVLTRRLLYSQGVQLYSDLPGAPEIKDAVVLTLGETHSSTAQRNGRSYGVVEQQYAIFPERSGAFTIPAISITASVRLVEDGRSSRKGVRVGTEDVGIEVLPVPPEYPQDQPWLPAERVRLFDVINPDIATHEVGDTLTHELLIHMEGNIGTMAPPVNMTIDEQHFRIYPQTPDIQDDTTGSTVKGSRLQTHSLVPLVPGALQLPATELVWWDTVNRHVRISKTRPRSIQVSGQPVAATPNPTVEGQADQPSGLPRSQDLPKVDVDWRPLLPYLLACAALIALGILLWSMRHRWSTLLQARMPTAGNSEQAARRKLLQALASENAQTVHKSLLDYLSRHYGMPSHQALAAFCKQSQTVNDAVNDLLDHLYGDGADLSTEQRAHLHGAIKDLSTRRYSTAAGPLPELYPQTS